MVQEQGGVITGENPSHYNAKDPIVIFIIQVVLIVVVVRLLDLVLSKLLQPRVISEVIGGIILGPSVLGQIPGFTDAIFPKESLPQLTLIANIGLVLYLFLVGVELDPRMVLRQAKLSLSISAIGMILPFGLGVAVSYGLYHVNNPERDVSFTTFLLFMGVAISITAFPVLARIITELKLTQTRVGSTALCAAVGDDITAWVLLALVVTIVNASNSLTALYIALLAIAWGLVLIFLVRPLLLRLIIKTNSHINGPTVPMMAFTLLLVLSSAFVTDIIGVHAIFGAFMVGVIIPHSDGFARGITERIEDLISILFLPVFFAISGLKTEIGLLNNATAWGYIFLVIFVAMVGKISGCTLVSRAYGIPWREAFTIGVFMSCKGLVELIVLNIGLDAKVIDKEVFAILVMMAIVTTCVTTPLAILIGPDELQDERARLIGGKKKSDDEELSVSSGPNIAKTKNNILVVLNKVEYISPMMSLIRLLQPIISDSSTRDSVSSDEKTAVRQQGDQEMITVHALRLMELGQRMSGVMKSHESAEIAQHDPIMNVFRIFGEQNIFNVESTLYIRPVNKFAEQVLQSAEQSSAELIVVPWSGAGSIAYDNPEDFYHPRENSDTNPQIAQYVQEVFHRSEDISVAAFIDRGLGMVPAGGIPASGRVEVKISMFVPFVAGADDREALSLVARFLESPYVEATVLRISKSDSPTEYDSQLEPISPAIKKDDVTATPPRPPVTTTINPVSSASIAVINYSTIDRLASNAADELHINKYFGPRGILTGNPRVKYSELKASTPMQTAVQHAKNAVGRKDLVIVGRGQRNISFSHRDEWMEMIRRLGIGGNDLRRSLGEMAAAMLGGGIQASVLVVQGKKERSN